MTAQESDPCGYFFKHGARAEKRWELLVWMNHWIEVMAIFNAEIQYGVTYVLLWDFNKKILNLLQSDRLKMNRTLTSDDLATCLELRCGENFGFKRLKSYLIFSLERCRLGLELCVLTLVMLCEQVLGKPRRMENQRVDRNRWKFMNLKLVSHQNRFWLFA